MVINKFGDRLYNGLIETETAHLREIAAKVEAAQGEGFLKELKLRWEHHTKSMHMIRDILMVNPLTFSAEAGIKLIVMPALNQQQSYTCSTSCLRSLHSMVIRGLITCLYICWIGKEPHKRLLQSLGPQRRLLCGHADSSMPWVHCVCMPWKQLVASALLFWRHADGRCLGVLAVHGPHLCEAPEQGAGDAAGAGPVEGLRGAAQGHPRPYAGHGARPHPPREDWRDR